MNSAVKSEKILCKCIRKKQHIISCAFRLYNTLVTSHNIQYRAFQQNLHKTIDFALYVIA